MPLPVAMSILTTLTAIRMVRLRQAMAAPKQARRLIRSAA